MDRLKERPDREFDELPIDLESERTEDKPHDHSSDPEQPEQGGAGFSTDEWAMKEEITGTIEAARAEEEEFEWPSKDPGPKSDQETFKVNDRRSWARDDSAPEPEPEPQPEPPAYVVELEQRNKDLEDRLRTTLNAYLRLEEETKKIRERLERDREKRLLQEKQKVFSRLLEPVDNLERSLAAAGIAGDVSSLVTGLNLVVKQVQEALASCGMVRFDPQGQPFDPQLHEAVTVQPVDSQDSDNRIVATLLVGYTLDGELMRAARVVVGRFTEPSAQSD